MSILTSIDDIQLILEDHIIKAQTMKGSPFVKPFEKEMNDWEAKLMTMQQITDNWLKVSSLPTTLVALWSNRSVVCVFLCVFKQ